MGHGHVVPNPDGSKARCGGEGICLECARERAAVALRHAGDGVPAPASATAAGPGVTRLRIIDSPGPLYARATEPGDMWRDPSGDWEDGECWRVILPNGQCWRTNQQAVNGGRWEVTGTPPAITVTPSIWDHSSPDWHGWIRDGQFITA